MKRRRKDLLRDVPYSGKQLEEMSIYDLLALASGLGVPK